jgi:hypothetical protein
VIDYCKLIGYDESFDNYNYTLHKLKDIGINKDKEAFNNTFKTPSKTHGNPVKLEKAIQKCIDKSSLLTSYEKLVIDKNIDKSLMEYFNLVFDI